LSDLLASFAHAVSVQDKGHSEEREDEAASSGIEHRGDAEGRQFWTWYGWCVECKTKRMTHRVRRAILMYLLTVMHKSVFCRC